MEIIKYRGFDWIVLEETNDSYKLLKKDCIEDVECEFNKVNEALVKFYNENNLKGDIRSLTAHEVIDLDCETLKSNNWYWTMDKVKGTNDYAFGVSASGSLSYTYVYYGGIGVRPVLILDKKDLDLDLDYEHLYLQEKEKSNKIIELIKNECIRTDFNNKILEILDGGSNE